MALAALGKNRREWIVHIMDAWRQMEPFEVNAACPTTSSLLDTLAGFGYDSTSKQHRYDLIRTAQDTFTGIVIIMIGQALNELGLRVDGVHAGVVLSGGCAMNVLANEAVRSEFRHVYVPSAPNDSGLSIGAALLLRGPEHADLSRAHMQRVHLYGPNIWDLAQLNKIVSDFGGVEVNINQLAAILAGDNIVGVVRGRTEVGPRALGHRSLLCYPANQSLHAKLNLIKGRQWYRPVAPMTTVESLPTILGFSLQSPFMSFAPVLTDGALEAFPVIAHFDGTARVQTVSKSDDEWLWELLRVVGSLRGSEILGNTSFNARGKPILNSAAAALKILHEEEALKYVLIEDFLFEG
jgi:carbamoyltransferase